MRRNKIFVYKMKKIHPLINEFLSKYNFSPGQKVLIKPNWVNSRDSSTGVTTDMNLIEEVIKFLKKKKIRILIAEGSGYEFDTDKAFEILNVNIFNSKYGVKIINTRKCETKKVNIKGKILKKINLPVEAVDCDYIINMPKIKTHVLTGMSLCMKNLFGLLPDKERRFVHVLGLHQSIVDLADYFNEKTINILDGLTAVSGEGPVFGDTINLNLIIVGTNMADIDKLCCKILDVDFRNIKHIKLAKHIFSKQPEIITNHKNKIPKFDLPTASTYYKLRYWGVFALDFLLSKFLKQSLIPKIVTKYGVRLEMENEKCNNCNKCIKICPINAINRDTAGNLKIDYNKCRYVRCFRCFDICDEDAIKIKGFSKPHKKEI